MIKKILLVVFLLYFSQGLAYSKPSVLFIGSSTIDYWRSHLARDFPEFNTIDEGVGAITYPYLSQHIAEYARKYPSVKKIVVYAGDNDIAIPFKSKTGVAYDFSVTMMRLHAAFPDAHIFVFSIKPCPAVLIRASTQTVKETNDLILKNVNQLNHYFQLTSGKKSITFVDIFPKMLGKNGYPDMKLFCMPLGIHLNDRGYKIWTDALTPLLNQNA